MVPIRFLDGRRFVPSSAWVRNRGNLVRHGSLYPFCRCRRACPEYGPVTEVSYPGASSDAPMVKEVTDVFLDALGVS